MATINFERGKSHRISVGNEHMYLFIAENGKHEATIPYENRPENQIERYHFHILMKRLSELHGYFEQED